MSLGLGGEGPPPPPCPRPRPGRLFGSPRSAARRCPICPPGPARKPQRRGGPPPGRRGVPPPLPAPEPTPAVPRAPVASARAVPRSGGADRSTARARAPSARARQRAPRWRSGPLWPRRPSVVSPAAGAPPAAACRGRKRPARGRPLPRAPPTPRAAGAPGGVCGWAPRAFPGPREKLQEARADQLEVAGAGPPGTPGPPGPPGPMRAPGARTAPPGPVRAPGARTVPPEAWGAGEGAA